MSEVCFFCSPTYCLQPNCALDKWRERKTAREAAIKINHLDKHAHTHTHTHRRLWGPVLFVRMILRVHCVFVCTLPDSTPILLNLHPLCNLCFSFYHLSVIHSGSSNYRITVPPLSCISSQHSSLNYLFYPFFPSPASHSCAALMTAHFTADFLQFPISLHLCFLPTIAHYFRTVSP